MLNLCFLLPLIKPSLANLASWRFIPSLRLCVNCLVSFLSLWTANCRLSADLFKYLIQNVSQSDPRHSNYPFISKSSTKSFAVFTFSKVV